MLCITYLTLACRLPTSSNSKLDHRWEKDTWELLVYLMSGLGFQSTPEQELGLLLVWVLS